MVYFQWQPSTLVQNFIHLSLSAAEFMQKSMLAATTMLNFVFVQYFATHIYIFIYRITNIIQMKNFMQMCAIVNELWTINEIQNGGHRHLEYYFCRFWSNGLFPVAADYITAKFYPSMSISGWVITVCAKIQDGGRRDHGFYFCLIFWHTCM